MCVTNHHDRQQVKQAERLDQLVPPAQRFELAERIPNSHGFRPGRSCQDAIAATGAATSELASQQS
jgi:hypothetical protein